MTSFDVSFNSSEVFTVALLFALANVYFYRFLVSCNAENCSKVYIIFFFSLCPHMVSKKKAIEKGGALLHPAPFILEWP